MWFPVFLVCAIARRAAMTRSQTVPLIRNLER